MRITDEIQLDGEFWLPATPDKKVHGRLSIKDGGKIRVDVTGLLRDFATEMAGENHFPRIVGEIEKHGYITLDNCIAEDGYLTPGGISKCQLMAHFAFLGVAYDEGETPTFQSLSFGADGLDAWHGDTGFRVDTAMTEHSASIHYQRPEKRLLWQEGDWTLELRFAWQPPAMPAETQAAITQSSYLYLRSTQARPLGDFITRSQRMSHLLSIATDQTVSIRKVTVTSADLREGGPNDDQYEKSIPVYFESVLHAEEVRKVRSHDLIFRLSDLPGNSQNALSAWFQLHERSRPAMNLYFGAQAGVHRFADSRFLALAQALETFHRRNFDTKQFPDEEFERMRKSVDESTAPEFRDFVAGRLKFGNEPSLSARLKELLAPYGDLFGTEKEQKSLVARIVAARNYYTHFPAGSEKGVAEGEALWWLSYKMDAIFRMVLLAQLGFSNEQIRDLAKRRFRLKRLLDVKE